MASDVEADYEDEGHSDVSSDRLREAGYDSEDDEAGDIIPGPGNFSVTTPLPMQKGEEIERKLKMIHASLVRRRDDGMWEWDVEEDVGKV